MLSRSCYSVAILTALLLGGCKDAENSAVPWSDTAPAPSTAPVAPAETTLGAVTQVGALVVDESKVALIESSALAAAEWTGENCSLDSVDGIGDGISVNKGTPHIFRGFLIDKGDVSPGAFSIILKGKESYEVPTSTGAARPDVAEFFKNPSLAQAGYEFSTTLTAVAPGNYSVWMLMRHGENSTFCEAGKSITVK